MVSRQPGPASSGGLEVLVGGGSLVTHLQHVQQRRLSGVVEAEEQQLGVLVEQAERRENVVDCEEEAPSCQPAVPGWGRRKHIHQLIIHILAGDARLCLSVVDVLGLALVGLVQGVTAAWSNLGRRCCVGWWRGRKKKVSDKGRRLTVNAIRVRLVAFGLDDSRFSPVQASQTWRGSLLAGSKSGPANDWPRLLT